MAQRKFAILGAGAIGSILGAHLARAGHSVVMLARDPRAADLERAGLRLRGLSEFACEVPVLRDPQGLADGHVLIVAMKSPGTRSAIERIPSGAVSVAFSIQNGLAKNETLTEVFGRERVLGALADTSGELLPSGEVLFTRNVNILLGELDASLSPRVTDLARIIDESGVRAAPTQRIVSLEWSKFCAWAGFMLMSVVTRSATWKLLSQPDSARLVARLIREIGTLAAAVGISLSDESVLPVASLCAAPEAQALEILTRRGREFKTAAPNHRMSSLQDLEAGRALEIEETLGYARRKALELKLALPLLETTYYLARALDGLQRPEFR